MTLQQAQALNNKLKGDTAWVYDRFVGIEDEFQKVVKKNNIEAFHIQTQEFISVYRKHQNSTKKLKKCWVIYQVSDFDTQEQIDDLISKGEFYYIVDIEKIIFDKIQVAINGFQELRKAINSISEQARQDILSNDVKREIKSGIALIDKVSSNGVLDDSEIIISAGITRNPSLKRTTK